MKKIGISLAEPLHIAVIPLGGDGRSTSKSCFRIEEMLGLQRAVQCECRRPFVSDLKTAILIVSESCKPQKAAMLMSIQPYDEGICCTTFVLLELATAKKTGHFPPALSPVRGWEAVRDN